MSSVVKQLLYVLKLFRVTAGCIHSFRICSKETLRIMYPKYPVLDIIQRMYLRCGSFWSIIRFWILLKKRNIRFWIKIRIWILVKKRTLTDHPVLSTYNFKCCLPPQEKLKKMLIQNFGVTNEEHYGMLWYFLELPINCTALCDKKSCRNLQKTVHRKL